MGQNHHKLLCWCCGREFIKSNIKNSLCPECRILTPEERRYRRVSEKDACEDQIVIDAMRAKELGISYGQYIAIKEGYAR